MTSERLPNTLPKTEAGRLALADLQSSAPRQRIVSVLLGVAGFSASDLGELSAVSTTTISDWTTNEHSEPLPEYLDDVRAITEYVVRHDMMDVATVGSWFRSPNDNLGGDRPIDRIELSDGVRAVLMALHDDQIDQVAISRVKNGEVSGSTSIEEFAAEFGVEPGLADDS